MKSFRSNTPRQSRRLEHLSYRLRIWLLVLAGIVIGVSLLLAVVLFGYILNLALNPEVARELIDRWSQVFLERSGAGILNLPTLAGPARWFAVFTLGILAFLLTRIPLLLMQMGTQMLIASTDERRLTQDILRTLLVEMRQDPQFHNSGMPSTPPEPHPYRVSSGSSDQEYP
jgi:hypothetical protein